MNGSVEMFFSVAVYNVYLLHGSVVVWLKF